MNNNSKKRKIIKIQYLSCDSIFDDDYKRKHEIRQHAGKKK
jgi:hypothetical protein